MMLQDIDEYTVARSIMEEKYEYTLQFPVSNTGMRIMDIRLQHSTGNVRYHIDQARFNNFQSI